MHDEYIPVVCYFFLFWQPLMNLQTVQSILTGAPCYLETSRHIARRTHVHCQDACVIFRAATLSAERASMPRNTPLLADNLKTAVTFGVRFPYQFIPSHLLTRIIVVVENILYSRKAELSYGRYQGM